MQNYKTDDNNNNAYKAFNCFNFNTGCPFCFGRYQLFLQLIFVKNVKENLKKKKMKTRFGV